MSDWLIQAGRNGYVLRASDLSTCARKVFRDSAVTNLTEFFEKFRHWNVRSNAQLDELVEQAQRVVQSVGAQEPRDNEGLRQHVATQLAGVQSVLDGMLVDRPRRTLIRKRPAQGGY